MGLVQLERFLANVAMIAIGTDEVVFLQRFKTIDLVNPLLWSRDGKRRKWRKVKDDLMLESLLKVLGRGKLVSDYMLSKIPRIDDLFAASAYKDVELGVDDHSVRVEERGGDRIMVSEVDDRRIAGKEAISDAKGKGAYMKTCAF
jgi:hypothetical protein